MSSNLYPVDDYGFVLDEETIKAIARFIVIVSHDTTYSDLARELYEKEICEIIPEFSGEAICISDDGKTTWDEEYTSYYCDTIAYVPTSKYPTLFDRPYNDMDEIIAEFKDKLGKYLSDDFNYRNNICHITGTYYG